jgi:hypothetical protein
VPERERLSMSSLYGARTNQGRVQLDWGDKSAQLTVDEARRHALAVIETASAAEFDELIAEVLREAGFTMPDIAAVMQLLRDLLHQEEGYWSEDMPINAEQLTALRIAQQSVEQRQDARLSKVLEQRHGGKGRELVAAVQARRAQRYA